jgi:hypothetical protein
MEGDGTAVTKSTNGVPQEPSTGVLSSTPEYSGVLGVLGVLE